MVSVMLRYEVILFPSCWGTRHPVCLWFLFLSCRAKWNEVETSCSDKRRKISPFRYASVEMTETNRCGVYPVLSIKIRKCLDRERVLYDTGNYFLNYLLMSKVLTWTCWECYYSEKQKWENVLWMVAYRMVCRRRDNFLVNGYVNRILWWEPKMIPLIVSCGDSCSKFEKAE